MAIARDNSTFAYENPLSGTLDFSHTVAGTDRLLIVYGTENTAATGLSGCTYNGVTATEIATVNNNATATNSSNMYALVAPSTGTNTVSVSCASSTSWVCATAASYTGVSQSSVPTNTNSARVGTTTHSISLTISADSWMVLGTRATSSGNTTASTGATVFSDDDPFQSVYDTNGAPGSGSRSMTVTTAGSEDVGLIIAEMEVAGAAASTFTPKVMFF